MTEETTAKLSKYQRQRAHGKRRIWIRDDAVMIPRDTLVLLVECALDYHIRLPHGIVPPEISLLLPDGWLENYYKNKEIARKAAISLKESHRDK